MTNEFQLPGNSYNKREPEKKAAETERPKLEQITTGNVTRKKKSLRRKFSDLFFQGDTRSAMEIVMKDVIVPGIKYAIVDSFDKGLSSLLGTPENRSSRPRANSFLVNDGNPTRTAYERISASRRDERPSINARARANHDFDEIIFDTRVEALEVLAKLIQIVEEYNAVTIADLYELTGQTEHHTDRKFGWTDLRGSDVVSTRDGYLLELPKPTALD